MARLPTVLLSSLPISYFSINFCRVRTPLFDMQLSLANAPAKTWSIHILWPSAERSSSLLFFKFPQLYINKIKKGVMEANPRRTPHTPLHCLLVCDRNWGCPLRLLAYPLPVTIFMGVGTCSFVFVIFLSCEKQSVSGLLISTTLPLWPMGNLGLSLFHPNGRSLCLLFCSGSEALFGLGCCWLCMALGFPTWHTKYR